MAAETKTYTRGAIILHWVIAILIIGQLSGGLIMERLPPTGLKFEMYQLHKSFGILILFLTFVRLSWRLTHPVPPLPAAMKPWERTAARATHIAFYVILFVQPLAGWAMVSASTLGIDTVLFKVIPWPHLPGIPQDEGLEDILKEIHEYMAFGMIGLVILHVGAALKHHFVERDDVLARILPLIKR